MVKRQKIVINSSLLSNKGIWTQSFFASIMEVQKKHDRENAKLI